MIFFEACQVVFAYWISKNIPSSQDVALLWNASFSEQHKYLVLPRKCITNEVKDFFIIIKAKKKCLN